MRKGTHYKMMRESDFQSIKTLLNMGTSLKTIVIATGRSRSTLSSIKRSDTFEQYKSLVKSYSDHFKQKQAPVTAPVVADPLAENTPDYIPESTIEYTTDMYTLVNELRLVRQELHRLVDAWEARPEKKGLFR